MGLRSKGLRTRSRSRPLSAGGPAYRSWGCFERLLGFGACARLVFKVPGLQQGRGAYWDFAASACIFNAAGAVVTDFYGDGLHFNHPQEPGMPDRGLIYTSHASIADALRGIAYHGL